MNDAIALSLRLSIGLVFLVAAFFKLRAGPRAMRQNAEDFGLKGRSAVLTAAILPPAEATLAAFFLLGPFASAAGVILAGLSLAFAVAMVRLLGKGRHPECGCFGASFSSLVSWKLVLRNILLAVGALSVGVFGPGAWAITGVPTPIALGVGWTVFLVVTLMYLRLRTGSTRVA